MNHARPPLKSLIWAGKFCIFISFLIILLGVGFWTGLAGQVVDQTTGVNHGPSLARVFVFGGFWGVVVGFFAIRAGRRRDII